MHTFLTLRGRRVSLVFTALILSVGGINSATPDPFAGGTTAEADTQVSVSKLRDSKIGQRVTIKKVALEGRIDLVNFELERIQVFAKDAKIIVHSDAGDQVLDPPQNAYYSGTIAGSERTRVFLVARRNGAVRGIVAVDGVTWVLAIDEPGEKWIFERLSADRLKSGGQTFTCGADELSDRSPTLDLLTSAEPNDFIPLRNVTKAAASYTARVAVETDWEFYRIFGNAADATDYVGDLIGYASGIYADEIDTTLVVSHLSLWSTSFDPWDETSTICGLFEFGQYWNHYNTRINRTIAHFMSGKHLGGGIAWTSVLCSGPFNPSPWGYTPSAYGCGTLTPDSDVYGGAYGFTASINGSFNAANPGPVWDIISVTHEIGHNFSSPHTHCYKNIGGNASPVDECWSAECSDSCNCNATSLPCDQSGAGCGTIMSYCHQLSGGYANISLSFGEGHPYGTAPERVPAKMYSHVVSVALSNPSCLAFVDDTLIFDDGFELNNTNAWSTNFP